MGGRTPDTVDERTFEQLTGKRFRFLAHLSSTFVMQGFIVLLKNGEESLLPIGRQVCGAAKYGWADSRHSRPENI